MKILFSFVFFLILISPLFSQEEPWKKEQVMSTQLLADKINANGNIPIIVNVGPMENIKTAIAVGAVNTPEGLGKLAGTMASMDRNREVVIYCGCCSYSNCPNIRPAFKKLQDMGFKKVKVLNIPEGLLPDWKGKGYPME